MLRVSRLICASTVAIMLAAPSMALAVQKDAPPPPPKKPSTLSKTSSKSSSKASSHAKASASSKSAKSTSSSVQSHASAVPLPLAKPSEAPQPLPVARPGDLFGGPVAASASAPLPAARPQATRGVQVASRTPAAAAQAEPSTPTLAVGASADLSLSAGDLQTLKSAVTLARNGKGTEALSEARGLNDEVARSLVTWLVIRHAPNDLGFDGINAFINEKPGWPTPSTLRRRAERMLFIEKRDPATVRAFFASHPPVSGEGKIALARALAVSGQTREAVALAREAYRDDELSENFEAQVLEDFGSAITRGDHKARADRFSYKPDTDRALRAAVRAGSDIVSLTKARLAVARNESKGPKLLAAVPSSLSRDPAYLFAKSQVLRRQDKPQEAARALLAADPSPAEAVDTDEWWIERRLVARELLDVGDPRTAYKVATTGPKPESDNYRAEQPFTAGWIALRFLKDPRAAAQNFAQIAKGQDHPITLSRAYYWQARAAEALGDTGAARSNFQAAAQFPATYYGQLARTHLGMQAVNLRDAPQPSFSERNTFARLDAVKAIRMLYAIGESDYPMTIYYDLSWRMDDAGQLGMLADLAEANHDARGALVVGKESMAEGFALEKAAFPTFGLPSYTPIGTPVDKAAVYAVARQESQFNPRTLSSAQAMGLMQVTPAAGRQVAKTTGASYSESRLRTDQSYNVQFGAAELGELLDNYGPNYVLIFAAYNAGRGNVAKWISRYGDPRDPDVDVLDWVERIPFSETRNYVQRVMENYQAYKVLFDIPTRHQMEADLRGTRAR